jgi:hypothetical protein
MRYSCKRVEHSNSKKLSLNIEKYIGALIIDEKLADKVKVLLRRINSLSI